MSIKKQSLFKFFFSQGKRTLPFSQILILPPIINVAGYTDKVLKVLL